MLSITHFHYAHGLATRRLAQSSDSLVRVSRRVGGAHFVRVTLHERVGNHARRAQVACETPRRYADPAAERASVRSDARTHGCPKASRATSTPRQTHPDRARQSTPSRAESTRAHWKQPLSPQQVQVLFNSLFKVLCIFPSRYLFAIGLSPVFSFGRNLPPVQAAIPSNPTLRSA